MANFSVTGLSSGIDFAQLIDATIEVERQPVVLLEAQKAKAESLVSLYQTLNSRLLALGTAVNKINLPSEFSAKSTTVTNNASTSTTFLTASASGAATSGTHTVIVNQLAQAEKEVHDGVSSDTSVVNSSGGDLAFEYTYGGTQRTLTVPDGTTLEGLRDLINNDTANPGVNATILNDGSGGATAYHLALEGKDTGSTNTITIDGGTTLNGTNSVDFQSGTFAQTQGAQNAQIRVDGYPTSGYIERETNTITDVINGVTFNLQRADNTVTNTVTVTTDIDKDTEKVSDFVTAYNDVVSFIKENTKFDPALQAGGPLTGELTVLTVLNRVQSIVTSQVFTSGTFTSLSQIGIRTNEDDTLFVDSSDLSDAISEDFTAVSNLFVNNGTTSGVAEQLSTLVDELTGTVSAVSGPVEGLMKAKQSSLNQTILDLNDQISKKEDELDKLRVRLELQFVALESLLSSLTAQGSAFTSFLSGA
jgi:flagellar hook-associated protein 2